MVGNETKTWELRRRIAVATVIAALLMVSTLPASAQTANTPRLADGDYGGVIGLSGEITSDPIDGSTLVIGFDGVGTVDIVVADDFLVGDWFLPFDQTISGEFTSGGNTLTITGGGVTIAEGDLDGVPGDYRMTGTYESDSTVTVAMPQLKRTNSSSDAGQAIAQLTDVLGTCDTITGRWDYGFKQSLQGADINESIRGYFTAWMGGTPPEQSDEAKELIGDINNWASMASSVGPADADVGAFVSRGLDLLLQAQVMQASRPPEEDCPLNSEFMNEMTLAAQDALAELVGKYPTSVSAKMAALAVGAGAVGKGSPTPPVADALQQSMEQAINDSYDVFSDDVFESELEIIDLAIAAETLGMETMGSSELSPSDVLLLVGEGG